MSSQRLVPNLWACGRDQSPRAAHGLYAHTACAIGGTQKYQQCDQLLPCTDTGSEHFGRRLARAAPAGKVAFLHLRGSGFLRDLERSGREG
eukprot:scaffold51284_cov41-Phaeocystis_antarctica.AAC.1